MTPLSMNKLDLTTRIVPRVLILSSKFDFSCDYVVAQLRKRGISYFRLNTEDLGELAVVALPDEARVSVYREGVDVQIDRDTLKAIYFRRGVFPREAVTEQHSAQEQLARAHWSVFMRSFMVFDSCLWVNHPVATYRAEHKAIQLAVARSMGFEVPRTVITNDPAGINEASHGSRRLAIKGLDTVLAWQDGYETFGYTTLVDADVARHAHLSSVPFIAQEALENKLDLRVTVAGQQVWCASVTYNGNPIPGDWRLHNNGVGFRQFELPQDIARKCWQLCQTLGLVFGAIDLALQDGKYYFLEINPTGEWGWLVDQAGLPIDEAIAEALLEAE